MTEKREATQYPNRNQVASLKILKVISFLETPEQQAFLPKFLLWHR
jgi:hypothetical protein